MSSQSFLWINVGLAVAMAALFLLGRVRMRPPARLHLRRGEVPPGFSSGNRLSSGDRLSAEAQHISSEGNLKNLNVIFIYNGHTWDAHEVLGVPAGARFDDVHLAYRKALEKADLESRSFIEAAYLAITAESAAQ
jgi:hypothetical protein